MAWCHSAHVTMCAAMARANLISFFDEFERYARDVAVVQRRGYRRESWTYGRLAATASHCARTLRDRGVRTGDRVILWGPNTAEWIAAFWGCLLRGVAAVPLDDGVAQDFAARVARETNAKLVFAARGKPEIQAGEIFDLEDLSSKVNFFLGTEIDSASDFGRRPGEPMQHHPAARRRQMLLYHVEHGLRRANAVNGQYLVGRCGA